MGEQKKGQGKEAWSQLTTLVERCLRILDKVARETILYNKCLVRIRTIGTTEVKFVSMFSEGLDTAFVEPKSFSVSDVIGNKLFVGCAGNAVKRGMDFVTSTITFGTF